MKKSLEISSFYTSAPKLMIICYTVHKIWCVTDVIVIFHFELFFALLPNPTPPPFPPNFMIRWYTVPEIWCLADGQMDRWKKWHIEWVPHLKMYEKTQPFTHWQNCSKNKKHLIKQSKIGATQLKLHTYDLFCNFHEYRGWLELWKMFTEHQLCGERSHRILPSNQTFIDLGLSEIVLITGSQSSWV